MKLHILNTLRTEWTDAVVARWAASSKYKLGSASCACKDCGHPVAYVKGGGDPLCSACMIISAKFPFGEGEKTTQLVNGKGVGGVGLLALPDRAEIHLWLNQPLQTHVAVLELQNGSGIIVHPTANKGNTDLSAFVGDLVLWRFAPGECYWAGICQENDSHKVSHLLQAAIPCIWNEVLSIRKSVLSTVYIQPKTMAALKAMASNAYWQDFAREVVTHTRILGDLDASKETIMAQMDGAETTDKKAELIVVMEKEKQRLEKILQSRIENEIEASDMSRQSFGQFMASSLGGAHDETLMSIHENLLSVWS